MTKTTPNKTISSTTKPQNNPPPKTPHPSISNRNKIEQNQGILSAKAGVDVKITVSGYYLHHLTSGFDYVCFWHCLLKKN